LKLLLENWREYLQEENIDHMLQMSLHDFDQTSQGWRKFANPADQVEVIKKYIEANPDAKKDQVLAWHLGQALAFDQKVDEAVKTMEEVLKNESIQFNKIYYELTIHFLRGEMDKFNKLYYQFESEIDKFFEEGITNALIVNCMKQCGEKSNFDYKSAYTSECKC